MAKRPATRTPAPTSYKEAMAEKRKAGKQKAKDQVAVQNAANRGQSGWNTRKLEAIKQHGRTARTTAIASSAAAGAADIARSATKNRQQALEDLNNLILGSEKEGESSDKSTGDTNEKDGTGTTPGYM